MSGDPPAATPSARYRGWDTTVSVNEETADPDRIPGTAGVVSTLLLLVTYFLVVFSVQAFAGTGTMGIGLQNPAHENDVLSVMGSEVFGHSGLGRIQPRYLTPTVSTIVFSVVSVVMYVVLNYVSGGFVLADSVTAATFFVVIYLGITGFACFWFYRRTLLSSARSFWLRGVFPLLSGIMLFGLLGYNAYYYLDPSQSYTTWLMPFYPHWRIGGVMSIAVITGLAGLACMIAWNIAKPAFFRGDTLRDGFSITDDDRVVRVQATAPEATD